MTSRRKILKQFCKNTNFPCCNVLFQQKISRTERIFWVTTLIFFCLCIFYTTFHIVQDLENEAVFISLSTTSQTVNEVNFPGIAICNINVLSKTRTEIMADNIYKSLNMNNQYTKLEIFGLLKLLGNQYTRSVSKSHRFSLLQTILQSHLKERYNVEEILKNLSTPCKELISHCEWNQQSYECREIFQTRLTDSGFCCVFNNVRPITRPHLYAELNETTPTETRKFEGPGEDKGLSFLVHNNDSDYLYTIMESRGILVKVFSPYDYADQLSGAMQQILVEPEVKALITIGTNTLKTLEPNVGRLSQKYRKCRYKHEGDLYTGKIYSQSDCLVACKIKSTLSMCDCIPFMAPTGGFIKDNVKISTCEMIDIPCLNKYQGKWSRYYDKELEMIPTLKMEQEDSLICNCLPNCNEVRYEIQTNFFKYRSRRPEDRGTSQIIIYSNKANTNLYTKAVTITWYEAISTLGGLFALFMGISLLNITEILVVIFKMLVFKIQEKKIKIAPTKQIATGDK